MSTTKKIFNPNNVNAGFDAFLADSIKDAARKKTLRSMNAIKIVLPIISAIMERPGLDARPQEISTAFKSLINDISFISHAICQKIGIDPDEEKNYWVRNVFEKLISELLREEWVKNGKIDPDKILVCIDEILKKDFLTPDKYKATELTQDPNLRLSLVRALLPVITQAKLGFDLFRKIEDDLEHIGEKIYSISTASLDKIIDEGASESDKKQMLNILIQSAGELYSIAWRVEAERVIHICNNYKDNSDKLKKYLSKYPKGLPLEKLENDFSIYFEKMLNVAEKLIPNKKGNIEVRIKND